MKDQRNVTQEDVRAEILKDVRKSMLDDVFEPSYEGYAQWHNFMNKEYYEKYVEPDPTVYDICHIKEPQNDDQEESKKLNHILPTHARTLTQLVELFKKQQKILSKPILIKKKLDDEARVVDWLRTNSRHFAIRSPTFLKEIA